MSTHHRDAPWLPQQAAGGYHAAPPPPPGGWPSIQPPPAAAHNTISWYRRRGVQLSGAGILGLFLGLSAGQQPTTDSSRTTRLVAAAEDARDAAVAQRDEALRKLSTAEDRAEGALRATTELQAREAELAEQAEQLGSQVAELDKRKAELDAMEAALAEEQAALGTSGAAHLLGSAPVAPPVADAAPDVSYANCSEARAAGAAPVHQGDPGYGRHLDRDADGVGCE